MIKVKVALFRTNKNGKFVFRYSNEVKEFHQLLMMHHAFTGYFLDIIDFANKEIDEFGELDPQTTITNEMILEQLSSEFISSNVPRHHPVFIRLVEIHKPEGWHIEEINVPDINDKYEVHSDDLGDEWITIVHPEEAYRSNTMFSIDNHAIKELRCV